MKIIIVDDSSTFRKYLRAFIEEKTDYIIAGEYENGPQLLKKINLLSSEVVLMDINMPILDGIDTTKHLLWKQRNLKIIAVTSFYTSTFLKELICAGFKACIFKDKIQDELESTIQKVLDGNTHFPENIILSPS